MLRGHGYALNNLARRILNHTYTAMAARLLRVTLLAPVTGAGVSHIPRIQMFTGVQ